MKIKQQDGMLKLDAEMEHLQLHVGEYVVMKYRDFDDQRIIRVFTIRGVLQYANPDDMKVQVLPDGQAQALSLLPDSIEIVYPKGKFRHKSDWN